MWRQAGLLRRALLLTSLVTLSGLHVQQAQLPTAWCVVRVVPISFIGGSLVAIIGYQVTVLNSAKDLMYSLTSGATVLHSLLVLLHLLRHRRQLHRLLRDVGRLEEATALCGRPTDHVFVRRQSVILAMSSIFSLFFWLLVFFVTQELRHPNYPLDWSIPVAMQQPPWYYVALALQAFFCIIIINLQVITDVGLVGFIDAFAVFQERLGRYFQELLNMSDMRAFCPSGTAPQNINQVGMELSSLGSWGSHELNTSRLEEAICDPGALDPPTRSVNNLWNEECPQPGRVKSNRVQPQLRVLPIGCLEVASDLESGLQVLTEAYTSLHQLFSDVNAFASLPILSLHACATTSLLLGGYESILMYHNNDTVTGQTYGFAVFTLVMVLRLIMVSSSGSKLIQKGQQLHNTLTAARWPGGVTSSARFSFQMLLERTRTPIAFEGWDLVTVKKGTMLSLFSFALTYFVIMVQMKVA